MAGAEDLLSNVQAMREQSDSEASESNHHLISMGDVAAGLPGAPRFTAKEILAIASSAPDCVAPYYRVMEDLDTRGQLPGLRPARLSLSAAVLASVRKPLAACPL